MVKTYINSKLLSTYLPRSLLSNILCTGQHALPQSSIQLKILDPDISVQIRILCIIRTRDVLNPPPTFTFICQFHCGLSCWMEWQTYKDSLLFQTKYILKMILNYWNYSSILLLYHTPFLIATSGLKDEPQ